MRIGIIGAGWYGCHLALSLKKAGHDVTLYEKNSEIFSQISGSFGIRLHAGPHYPRSVETRKSCHRGFEQFIKTYPELIVPHEYSTYALGITDADDNPSKVTPEQFERVCKESSSAHEVDLDAYGYQELHHAYNIDEPSIFLGKKLRSTFEQYLSNAGVKIVCNREVHSVQSQNGQVILTTRDQSQQFDKVINASSYQAHIPQNDGFPFDMEIVYQPCLALMYRDKQPGRKPFSFIVMDGWFPCLMPYVTDDEKEQLTERDYILTHGKWTIMGSYPSADEAKHILRELDDNFVTNYIKEPSAAEMSRFWPEFHNRFEYIGWKGEVIAKLKTKREFRSAVTFEKEGVIHIIPGKVSNIFDAEHEVLGLLHSKNILEVNGYQYVKGGVLDGAYNEILEKPNVHEANTANLQTYYELKRKASRQRPGFHLASLGLFKPVSPIHCKTELDATNHSFMLPFLAHLNLATIIGNLLLIALCPNLTIPATCMVIFGSMTMAMLLTQKTSNLVFSTNDTNDTNEPLFDRAPLTYKMM